jgi:hypothetical protein
VSDETVEGLTLERFTDLHVALFGASPDEREQIAQRHGVPPGRLEAVLDAWSARMEDPALALRYHELYQAALVRAGVEKPDVPFEQYVAMVRAIGAGRPAAEVCAEHGMTLQQWALVAQDWGSQMGRDPSLALRFAELMGYPGGAPTG